MSDLLARQAKCYSWDLDRHGKSYEEWVFTCASVSLEVSGPTGVILIDQFREGFFETYVGDTRDGHRPRLRLEAKAVETPSSNSYTKISACFTLPVDLIEDLLAGDRSELERRDIPIRWLNMELSRRSD